ncbi:hypothetical protein ACFFX1_18900 [Dactylosporangium sucinum]|uniref:Uncharacterized protein n=1 Tax=Dactylosporangium sucinum TaxID=1424081 RepID=A0A917X001_9ACTN|nr:tetratricopeptide repeat protein [Dactylosporangium sucinum]GGM46857.1 hypothetical protein GCM10007977_055680 [Dactylosporangium sucinum]
MFSNETARAVAEGYEAFEAEDWPQAGDRLAAAAARLAGKRAKAVWFDAALAYKFARDWPRAYETGKIAVTHVRRGESEPAFWNLGTAATVLRDWDTARDCWAGYGLPEFPGTGQIDAELGPACVRLSGVEEVVWAMRLCPTRARVINVPFDPTRRFGEVVVHDGAPSGERTYGEVTVPVFDEVALFEPSDIATLSVLVTAGPGDLEPLAESFARRQLGFEILASRVDLCACCSRSSVQQERGEYGGEQRLFLGAPADEARALLDAWTGHAPAARSWTNLHPA